MGIGNLEHSGFISYCHKDDLKAYYETKENNELIEIKDITDTQRHLNSITIESVDSPLSILINDSDYVLYIRAGGIKEYDKHEVLKFRILGKSGQKIRWHGQFF